MGKFKDIRKKVKDQWGNFGQTPARRRAGGRLVYSASSSKELTIVLGSFSKLPELAYLVTITTR